MSNSCETCKYWCSTPSGVWHLCSVFWKTVELPCSCEYYADYDEAMDQPVSRKREE